MQHLFVPYDIARQLKEKGFNEPCLMVFYGNNPYGHLPDEMYLPSAVGKITNSTLKDDQHDNVCAPLYQQVIDWFRDKQIKIIEAPNFDYEIWTYNDNNYMYEQKFVYLLIDQAIEQALKLITENKHK
jgi:hypothetical protein